MLTCKPDKNPDKNPDKTFLNPDKPDKRHNPEPGQTGHPPLGVSGVSGGVRGCPGQVLAHGVAA